MKLLLFSILLAASLFGGGWRGYWKEIPAQGNTCQSAIWVPATPRRAGYWLYPKAGYCFVWVSVPVKTK